MHWQPFILHAARALRQHTLRSVLSTLGIVFAIVALVAMLAIAEGARRETLAQIERLGTNNVVVRVAAGQAGVFTGGRRRSPLTGRDVRALRRRVPEAVSVAGLAETPLPVTGRVGADALSVLAVDEAYQSTMRLPVREGRFICSADVQGRNLVCVLGSEAVRALGRDAYLGGAVRLGAFTYRVVGILRAREWAEDDAAAMAGRNFNRAVFVPLGTVSGVGADGEPTLHEIVVHVARGGDVRGTAGVVRRILVHGRGAEDFEVIVPQELLHQARRTQRVFNVVLGGIAGISLIVGGIGIMNIMLAGVSERTKEIGIRRSIGANRTHIAAQFLVESVLLTLVGGFAGVLLGVAAAGAVSLYAGWPTAVTLPAVLLALTMAGVVGIASGLYPAVRAAQLDPVEALRYE